MKIVPSQARRGFTLIELLVVIAIIGILSSVVLASLNTARNKGADAAVKSNLANARAEAEIFYDSNTGANANTYTGLCVSGATSGIFDNAAAAAIAGGDTAAGRCNANATAWAASASLKVKNQAATNSDIDYYCVDSLGAARVIDTNISVGTGAANTVCPAN